MGIQHDEFADAELAQPLGDPQPAPHSLVEGQRPGAGDIDMFDRVADGLDGKEGDRQIGRQSNLEA